MPTLWSVPPKYAFISKQMLCYFEDDVTNDYRMLELVVTDNNDGILQKMHLPYNRDNNILTDISSSFAHVNAPLPSDDMLGFANNQAFRILSDAIQHYKLKYANRVGIPSVLNTYTSDQRDFYAIYGSADIQPLFERGIYNCHQYPEGFRQRVTKEQPLFAHLFTNELITNVFSVIYFFLSDGTSRMRVLFNASRLTLEANKMHCFPIGFAQLGLQSILNEQITFYYPPEQRDKIYCTGFAYALMKNATEHLMIRNFKLVEQTEESIYIAFPNRFGGIETIHFPFSERTNTTKFETAETNNFAESKRVGKRVRYNVEKKVKIKAKSAVVPRPEIAFMADCISEDCYLCEKTPFRIGFTKLICNTNEVTLPTSRRLDDVLTLSFELDL